MEQYSPIDGEKLLAEAAFAPVRAEARGRFTSNADMSKVAWFRAGGAAELLYEPADEADLARFLALLPRSVPLCIVGIGSNLLVRDGGIKGIVLRLPARGFGAIEQISATELAAGAAASNKRLAAAALAAGLGGFHFYCGIPGGIGGALAMNAGANGGETAMLLERASAVDRAGKMHRLSRAQMGFSYRSCAAAAQGLIFTQAVFKGKKADKAAIEAAQAEVLRHRAEAQPVREKTGGSTFRNPDGHSAWRLIEAAGCRGLQMGGAQISPMHCNFLVNADGASAEDLERLGEEARRRVFAQSGIRLRWEIKILGQFLPGHEIRPAF